MTSTTECFFICAIKMLLRITTKKYLKRIQTIEIYYHVLSFTPLVCIKTKIYTIENATFLQLKFCSNNTYYGFLFIFLFNKISCG